MGQNKSKEYEPGGNDIDGVANNVTQPTRNEVVRRESHAANDTDRRKRRKWRKKQGYSLPVVGGSMSNLNPEDQDLPPAPVERGAVLVSYSRSDAERFAPLRPKIINRRKDRQLSVDDVTSADLYDTPSSVRSCFALSPEKSRYLPSCDSLASIEPPLQQQQRSLASVSPPFQQRQQQQQLHFLPQLQQQMPPMQQPCDKIRSVPNVNSENFVRRDQFEKIVFENKSGVAGSTSSSHLDKDKKIEPAPMSYFEKVKKEIEKSDPIFEKVKQDIERERIEKDIFKARRELPKVDTEKMKTNERMEEKAEIVFNFEKIPKKENEKKLSVTSKADQKPIFVTAPTSTTSVPKSLIEKDGSTPTLLVPPPLPPRPSCTIQASSSTKGDQNVSSQQSPTQQQQQKYLHSSEKDDDAANRNKNMTFSATSEGKEQEEVGPLGAEVMTHRADNSIAINQNDNICNVTIGSNSIITDVTFGGDKVDGNSVKIRSNGKSDVIDRRPMRIPVPARISNIVESGHAPNLFSNFEDAIELSVDDDDDVTTEPLEIEQEPVSFQSPPFSRRVIRDDVASGIVTEPLAIVQEPVAYCSPRFSRRVKDCDDDSAILIDEDVEPDLVPAVRVEIYDEDDFDDDFPSFHNNSSVVRPFGSDVLSAITEEDKDEISSNLSSALAESLDQSFSRPEEKDNELETEFEESSTKNVVEDSTKPVNEFQTNSSQFKTNGFQHAFQPENFAQNTSNVENSAHKVSPLHAFRQTRSQMENEFENSINFDSEEEIFSDPNEICVDDIGTFYQNDNLKVLPVVDDSQILSTEKVDSLKQMIDKPENIFIEEVRQVPPKLEVKVPDHDQSAQASINEASSKVTEKVHIEEKIEKPLIENVSKNPFIEHTEERGISLNSDEQPIKTRPVKREKSVRELASTFENKNGDFNSHVNYSKPKKEEKPSEVIKNDFKSSSTISNANSLEALNAQKFEKILSATIADKIESKRDNAETKPVSPLMTSQSIEIPQQPNCPSDDESIFQTPDSSNDDHFVDVNFDQDISTSKLESNSNEEVISNDHSDSFSKDTELNKIQIKSSNEDGLNTKIGNREQSCQPPEIRPQLEGAVEKPIEPNYVLPVVVKTSTEVDDQNEIEDFIDSIFQYDDNECTPDEPSLIEPVVNQNDSEKFEENVADTTTNSERRENEEERRVENTKRERIEETENLAETIRETEESQKNVEIERNEEETEQKAFEERGDAIMEMQLPQHETKITQQDIPKMVVEEETTPEKISKRRFFEVAIVNTSNIETDVDTPSSSSSSEDEHEDDVSKIASPPIEIRSERRLPPVGCSSEDPASSGSASDDIEKGCYDSLEEDGVVGKSPPKQRTSCKEGPRRRRTLPNVPPDFSQQQKRAFETLLEPTTTAGHVQPRALVAQSLQHVFATRTVDSAEDQFRTESNFQLSTD